MPSDSSQNRMTSPHPANPLRLAGIGLRTKHYDDIVQQKPAVGWLEVHPENYFGGGLHRYHLTKARELYPLSLHAVGLSLGSDQPVDDDHLRHIKELIDLFEPFAVSDHASWSASGNAHLNDLLPLPYTAESLDRICCNIDKTQEFFGQKMLVENPSSYVSYSTNEMTEFEFMNALARRTGCGLLLDVNNIYVQSVNHGFDPYHYIDHIDAARVGEIHLAGHTERTFGNETLLVDTHNRPVRDEVWDLFAHTINSIGGVPTLIEWDGDIPTLDVLVAESDKAQVILDAANNTVCHDAA